MIISLIRQNRTYIPAAVRKHTCFLRPPVFFDRKDILLKMLFPYLLKSAEMLDQPICLLSKNSLSTEMLNQPKCLISRYA